MDLKSVCKYFSDLLIGLMFIILSTIFQSAISKDLSYLSVLTSNSKSQQLSMGIDGIYVFTQNKYQYVDIFKKTRPGANFYLGFHIEDVMLEIGYLFTSRRSKTTKVSTEGSFLQVPIPNNTKFTGKLRFKNTHIDLNFFSKLSSNLKVITGVGIGFVRTSINLKITDFNDKIINYNGNVEGKTSVIPRMGIGIIMNVGDNIMFRSMVYLEHHSRIQLKYAPAATLYSPFKEAYMALAGFVFRF